MNKRIVCLLLLLMILRGLHAQSISKYEYWTDDDYASRSEVTSSGGEVSLTVSTAALGSGIHYLNFRAQRDDGIWGDYCRYVFYIPEMTTSTTGMLSLEYWLDDDNAEMKSTSVEGEEVALTLDISHLKPGVHFFNCMPVSSGSGRGDLARYMFYVPNAKAEETGSEVAGYEYWIDDDHASAVKKQALAGEQLLTVGLSDLSSGVHYFNCRAYNERGGYGCPVREMFYLSNSTTTTDAKLASYEYWIDDDYTHHVAGESENAEQAFTIDVSRLTSGIHYFNYRAIDDQGRKGNPIRELFYIARIAETSASGSLEYEYWIDNDTENKVTGKGQYGEYVFNIDITPLDEDTHTFSFRAKNPLEQWSDTLVESFDISAEVAGTIIITAQDVMMTYGDAVPALTYTSRGGELIGDPLLSTTATPTSPVGEYPITVSKGSIINNHLVINPATLTITKAPLKIIVADAEMTEGDAVPEISITYEGFKNGETELVLTKLPVVSTIVTSETAAGEYVITITGAEAENYDITYVHGKFTVNKKPIVIGDVDGSGTIDITDMVMLINHIMGFGHVVEDMSHMDLNGDGEINVADVVLLRKAILNNGKAISAKARGFVNAIDAHTLSEFTAMQMDVTLPAGVNIESVELSCDNSKSHLKAYQQTDERSYRIIAYSMTNQLFSPAADDVVILNLEGSSEEGVSVDGIVLVKPSGESVETLDIMPFTTTGVNNILQTESCQYDVYDISGKKVRSAGEPLHGLSKGIYVINGKKKEIR